MGGGDFSVECHFRAGSRCNFNSSRNRNRYGYWNVHRQTPAQEVAGALPLPPANRIPQPIMAKRSPRRFLKPAGDLRLVITVLSVLLSSENLSQAKIFVNRLWQNENPARRLVAVQSV